MKRPTARARAIFPVFAGAPLKGSMALVAISLALAACSSASPTVTPLPPTATPAPTRTQGPDLAAILRQHYDAVNKGDIPGAVAMFADDAVAVRGSLCPVASPCKDKAAIQKQLEREPGLKVQYTVANTEVSGDKVAVRTEFRNVNTPGVGITRGIEIHTVTFRGDKVAHFVAGFDTSDPETKIQVRFSAVGRVIARHIDALNRGDLATAGVVLADDISYEGIGLCAAAPCKGKAAVQKEIERAASDKQNITVRLGLSRVSGNILTGKYEISSNAIKAAGVERVLATSNIEVRGGIVEEERIEGDKITSWKWLLDTTDAQTASYSKGQGK